jgi:CRISPR/Cas system-associated exonuclease Cas4 (RecB family)
MPFLERIAKKCLEEKGKELHKYAFVFPNIRAGLYFNRYLRKLKPEGQAIWAPAVFSISQFIVGLSDKVITDPLELIFQLYKIYHDRIQHYPRRFEDFYPWGKMIMADFNEIDKYVVDTDLLFRALREFKAVEDITRDEKADIYNRYIGFWDSLGQLYHEFRAFLQKENRAYEGMVYRDLAEQIVKDESLPQLKWEKVVFCGFNALTKAEETLFKFLSSTGRAEIYWDMDHYFVDDRNQEAGRFFRENRKTFQLTEPSWVDDALFQKKSINIIGVQSNVSQAKVMGLRLQELLESGVNPETIAVVLPDEAMLFPVLNSLPEIVDKVNITIGFPLHQTPVYSLFNAVMEMQLQELEKEGERSFYGAEGFYYKNVQRVLSHPYIKPISPDEIAEFLARIKKENRVYVTEKDIRSLSEPLKDFFRLRRDSHQLVEFFQDQLIFIRSFYVEHPELFDIDYEYMYQFYTLLTRLKDSLDASQLVLDLRTFRQLFMDIIKNSRIPFTGEPLEGLQIMGMLETQTLDFEHIFVLSVNEDHLPPGKGQQSFIPYNVRYELNLPTYEVRDAIAAYHFYRLLKRTKKATLIYTTEARRIEKSEKSRFLDQLSIEFADRNPEVDIRHIIVNFPPDTQRAKEIKVQKSAEIFTRLENKSYSASSILTYLSCSLKFYFTYVLKLYEEEEVTESPDYRLLGNIMHDTLWKMYEPYRGQKRGVTSSDLDYLKSRIIPLLDETYQDMMQKVNVDTGRNKIIFEVMRRFLDRFINKEKESSGFRVVALEEKFKNIPFKFSLNATEYQVKLEGTIDRLDRIEDDTMRIIDYKTGEAKGLKLGGGGDRGIIELLSGDEAIKRRMAFQLLFYWYILKRTRKYAKESFRLGIYSFKKMDQGLKFLSVDKEELIGDSLKDDMQSVLADIFQQLFDKDLPFEQTQDEAHCQVCPYKNICSKETGESYII